MAIVATQQIRQMLGGAQSHLMLASDRNAYVVKFQNNPQHLRVLANEFIVTKLAQAIGLTVPQAEIIDVPKWLIASTSDLMMSSERGTEPCKAGLQFGSRLVGGLMPGQNMDYLPERQLEAVSNRHEFAGMLLLDKWTCNSDGRQAVFHKTSREKHYLASFIDHGYCFDAGSWTFNDAPLRGVYARNVVYKDVKGWNSFEPWLSRIETLEAQTVWNIVETLPVEWHGGSASEMERLVEALFARRRRICDLISEFRDSSREPFPQWKRGSRRNSLSSSHSPMLVWKSSTGLLNAYIKTL